MILAAKKKKDKEEAGPVISNGVYMFPNGDRYGNYVKINAKLQTYYCFFCFQIDLNFSSTFIRRRVSKIARWCLVQGGNWRAYNQGRCGVLRLLG